MAKVVVPIDFGGTQNRCLNSPPMRDTPNVELIEAMIWNYRRRHKNIDEVAFFHAGIPTLEQLRACHPYQIRISAHPLDLQQIDPDLFYRAGVRRIEMKFLSLQHQVLKENKRLYPPRLCVELLHKFRSRGCEVGIILSPGLPRYHPELIMEDVQRLIDIEIDYVNIMPCIVWKGSGLASRFGMGWEPMSIEAAVLICREMVDRLEAAGIPVPRIGLQPGQDISAAAVAGPIHPNLRSLVQYRRFYDMMVALLAGHQSSVAVISVNPKDLSLVKGEAGENIKKLRSRLGLTEVRIMVCSQLPRGQIRKEEE